MPCRKLKESSGACVRELSENIYSRQSHEIIGYLCLTLPAAHSDSERDDLHSIGLAQRLHARYKTIITGNESCPHDN